MTVLVIVAIGCVGSGGADAPPTVLSPSTLTGATSDRVSDPTSDTTAGASTEGDLAAVVDLGNAKQPRSYDAHLGAAIVDNEAWWSTEFPEIYDSPYTPIAGGIFAGYPDRESSIPGCSGATETSPDDLAAYVAFYCADRDFFAYDDAADGQLVALADEYGPQVVGVVISHEWAHAIQNRAGIFALDLATVYTEQQADCVAGAWVARGHEGRSQNVSFDDAGVDAALAAIAEVRDPVGTSQYEIDGHGSAFDRLGAFQVGFDEGAARCAELIETPLPLTQNEYMPNSGDEDRDGDAPFSCEISTGTLDTAPGSPASTVAPVGDNDDCSAAPDFLTRDLNEFWANQVAGFPEVTVSFGGAGCADGQELNDDVRVCPESATIEVDAVAARNGHDEVGDFRLGYLLGVSFAEMRLAEDASPLQGSDRALARDCLTGLWIADITPNGSGQTSRNGAILSPGDLDETIETLFEVSDPTAETDRQGTTIEKIGALRTGLYDGTCDRYL